MEVKALSPITEEQFYHYWNLNTSAEQNQENSIIEHFNDYINLFPKTALGKHYWQIFDNTGPQPKILSAGGAISDLTPFTTAEALINQTPNQFFQCFHPNDLEQTLTFVAKFFSMLIVLPQEKRANLKATIYSRVRNSENKYVWAALQYPALYFNEGGSLLCGIALYNDVNHIIKDLSSPMLTVLDINETQNQVFRCYYPNSNKVLIHHYPKVTPREREIIGLLTQGKASKEIAAILHITKSTVDNHRQRLMKKFNVTSSAQLVHHALGL